MYVTAVSHVNHSCINVTKFNIPVSAAKGTTEQA